MKLSLLFLVILFCPTGSFGSPWDFSNDPHRFGEGYEFHFESLPLSGKVSPERMPWSESYWPRNKGSINLRWNAVPPLGFGYRSPTIDEARALGLSGLSRLSPSEKFDLYRGRYDYPLKAMISRTEANPRAPDWSGICDGWTASAIEFPEPRPVIRRNPDGIEIPFGASDVKALISYTAARQPLNSVVIGRYCPFGLSLGFSNCQDINPGSYHVILANEIGIKARSFPGEIDPGKEAWNQPLVGFDFKVLGSGYSRSGRALRIHSTLTYVDELERSEWNTVIGTDQQVFSSQESDYVLELDEKGQITGGYWLTKYSHPDVFWRPRKRIEFSGDFASLKEIYEPNLK